MKIKVEALLDLIRLYDAVDGVLSCSEYLDDLTYDWMISGGDINKINILLRSNRALMNDIREELITSGYRKYINSED